MSVHPSVPTGLQTPPCGQNPWYYITTEGPVHLRLLVWFSEPALAWKITNHRGRRGRPRARILTKPDLCIDQTEDGPTIAHAWILPPGAAGAHIWVAWSETCVLSIKQPQSPPIRLTYTSCAGTNGYVAAGSNTAGSFTLALAGVATVQTYLEGQASMFNNAAGFFATSGPGDYSIAIYQTLKANGSNQKPILYGIRNLSTSQDLTQAAYVIPPDNAPLKVNAAASWTQTVPGNQTIAAYIVPQNPQLLSGDTWPNYGYLRRA